MQLWQKRTSIVRFDYRADMGEAVALRFCNAVRNNKPYSITIFLNNLAYSRSAIRGCMASSLTNVYSAVMNDSSFCERTPFLRSRAVACPHFTGASSPDFANRGHASM